MKYQRYIGIDPGKSGGIAMIEPSTGHIHATKMADKTETEILDVLKEYSVYTAFCFVEKANVGVYRAKPGEAKRQQGVKGVWTSAQFYFGPRMALAALEIPREFVAASVWQKAMGCLAASGAKASHAEKKKFNYEVAKQLFPTVRVMHATADALLIAEYGRRKMEGIK